jgi:hypothetical protein
MVTRLVNCIIIITIKRIIVLPQRIVSTTKTKRVVRDGFIGGIMKGLRIAELRNRFSYFLNKHWYVTTELTFPSCHQHNISLDC